MTDTTSALPVRPASAVAPRLSGTVRIVGAGLLGASVGHALRAKGVDVALTDSSPAQLRLAVDYGAGRLTADNDQPSLIVVAVPPDVTADVVEAELERFPDAVVTDVASVKLEPFRELQKRGVDLTRYIGSHPLAGRERGERSPHGRISSSDARGSSAGTRRPVRRTWRSWRHSRWTSAPCRSR